MLTTKLLWLPLLLALPSCAGVPVAASCPPPPPIPAVLTSLASTGPSISERMEKLLADFEQELVDLQTKAQRAP